MNVRIPVLAAALMAGGVASAQTLVAVDDPKLPFRVSLPAGWLGADFGDKAAGVSVVSAKAPPATLIRLLYTPKNGAAVNLNSEFKKFEAGVTSSGVTLKQQSSAAATYGGVSGIERQYTLTHPRGQLRMRVWYGNGAKNLYSFQLTDSPARYAAASTLFSKVLSSLRFR
ncbi:hypothetical protein HNQ07_002517 [Deinococcus metalli]|uniref:DUF1795 domain-containing protein n=1 Tax=Deinococcus metalli TaxID=1141878 RepID=A0A7W8NNL6_9DEIO|nr:hypothetical protein [Deinococcus metalli]MBB5377044.1 hypothetical protein [Deinococcus metalli]GHF49351.1 hypothetical protein GCM10017781_27310 [Deinococcus metalli]